MGVPQDWIEYRRDDGELLGWIVPNDDSLESCTVMDLLGRDGGVMDWAAAEQWLENLGLAYLAGAYEYEISLGSWIPVRLVEVSSNGIRVKTEDFGDIHADSTYYRLDWPVGTKLRTRGY